MGNYIVCNDELYHHGVKGMKWGVRRKRESKIDKYGNNRKGNLLFFPHKKYSVLSKIWLLINRIQSPNFVTKWMRML